MKNSIRWAPRAIKIEKKNTYIDNIKGILTVCFSVCVFNVALNKRPLLCVVLQDLENNKSSAFIFY